MKKVNKKSTQHDDPKTENQSNHEVWYRTPSILISISSLLLSTIVSILTIFNSRYLARLDKDVYVPSLQYRIYPSDIQGNAIVEVVNQGYTSAQDVIVTIDWDAIEAKDCLTLPPYQDIEPVQPFIENNLTYRLTSLPVQSSFKVVCIFFTEWVRIDSSRSTFDVPTVISDSVTTPRNSTLGLDLRGDLQLLGSTEVFISRSNGEEVSLLSIKHPEDLITVNAVAENAKPAIATGASSTIWILANYKTMPP